MGRTQMKASTRRSAIGAPERADGVSHGWTQTGSEPPPVSPQLWREDGDGPQPRPDALNLSGRRREVPAQTCVSGLEGRWTT